jgi:DNA-binding NarL/FixJ family response regulator
VIRLIVADDQPRALTALAALLGTYGDLQVVATARDGDEAVDLAHLHHPDVVLMDVVMPRMDGLEATRRLKASLRATPVILLTMHGALAAAAADAGADGFLVKGVPGDRIAAEIRRQHARASGEALAAPGES